MSVAMKNLKTISQRRPTKNERELKVLLGLVQLYLETGRPVGSQSLKDCGFDDLSSATIRNYFAKLEEDDFVTQQHASGGRIPTEKGYRLFAEFHKNTTGADEDFLTQLDVECKEIAAYLQKAGEMLSEKTSCAVFLSAPRFDQDLILNIKLLGIDDSRCLCALLTDFGLVHTELLHTDIKLNSFALKRIEAYLNWCLTGIERPTLSPEEEKLAIHFYNELMLRHIVRYSNFNVEDIYKTGFSKLLKYPSFADPTSLANSLSLFENPHHLRHLLQKSDDQGELTYWIGSDLECISPSLNECAVIAVPYKINQTIVGSIAILGPIHLPYDELFPLLQSAAEAISSSLTKSIYTFKISYRKPKPSHVDFQSFGAESLLLEDKNCE